MNFKVADPKLADAGILRIEWPSRACRADGPATQVLPDEAASGDAHRWLSSRHQGDRGAGPHAARGGGRGELVGVQPLSTQDDVAAALAPTASRYSGPRRSTWRSRPWESSPSPKSS